jgi:hypothetical protein
MSYHNNQMAEQPNFETPYKSNIYLTQQMLKLTVM